MKRKARGGPGIKRPSKAQLSSYFFGRDNPQLACAYSTPDRQTQGSAHSLGISPRVWFNRHIQHLFLSAELFCTGQGISLFPSNTCASIINESYTVSCSFQETENSWSLTHHSHCAVFSRQKPYLARGVNIKPFSQQISGDLAIPYKALWFQDAAENVLSACRNKQADAISLLPCRTDKAQEGWGESPLPGLSLPLGKQLCA